MRARELSVALVFVFAAACARVAGDDPFTLNRNLETCARVQVVVDQGEAEALVNALARDLRAKGRFEVEVVHPDQTDAQRGGARIVLLGLHSPQAEALALAFRRAADRADVHRGLERDFCAAIQADPTRAWVATFADPERPGLPLTIALADTPLDAARVLGDLTPCARPSWRAFESGALAFEGELWRSANASAPPVIEVATARRAWLAAAEVRKYEGYEFRAGEGCAKERVDEYAKHCDHALARLAETLLEPGEKPAAPIAINLRQSVEAHLVFATRDDLASENPITGEVDAWLSPIAPDDRGAELARAYARAVLGSASARWLEDGVGCDASGSWWGRELPLWIAMLANAGLVPPIRALVSDTNDLSPHALVPLRAALVRFLAASRGKSAVRALWKGVDAPALDDALDQEFHRWLALIQKARSPELADRRAKRQATTHKRPLRRGANLVAPSVDRRVEASGFGSSKYIESIGRLRAKDANSVALFFEDRVEAGLPLRPGDRAHTDGLASACDVELFAGTFFARQRDLWVTFRPELMLGPSASYAGWMLLNSQSNWERLFHALERNSIHYALLGELCAVDGLCLGGQIAGASVTLPSETNKWEHDQLPWRREQWSKLIAKTRSVFDGLLTYAAQSMYEVRGIEFWQDLDAIGVELYPEIVRDGQGDELTRERAVASMLGTLEEFGEVSTRVGRPVLVLEVGFSSTEGAWKQAFRPDGDAAPEMQARLYDALGEALARSTPRTSAIRGFYLWSWSSDPLSGGLDDRGFSPQNKAAEAALKDLFHKP